MGPAARHAITECLRNKSEDTWPCATATGLTRRDRWLQQGECQQGQEGNDMNETFRIKTRQGIVLVILLNYDFNSL